MSFNAYSSGFQEPVSYAWMLDPATSSEAVLSGQTVYKKFIVGSPNEPYTYDHDVSVIASSGMIQTKAMIHVILPTPVVVARPDFTKATHSVVEEGLGAAPASVPASVIFKEDGVYVQFLIPFLLVSVETHCSGFFGRVTYAWSPTPDQVLADGVALFSCFDLRTSSFEAFNVSVTVTDEIGQEVTSMCKVKQGVSAGIIYINPAKLPALYKKHKWKPDTSLIVEINPSNPIVNIANSIMEFHVDQKKQKCWKMIMDGRSIRLSQPSRQHSTIKVSGGIIRRFSSGTHVALP